MADITRDEAVEIAHRTMYDLLGRRWVWPPVTLIERVDLVAGQDWISLEGRPVISISEILIIKPNAEVLMLAPDYVLENGYRIRFTGNTMTRLPFLYSSPVISSGCSSGTWSAEIAYTYGSRPPTEILRAIEDLASEFELAYNNPDECRLPDTVTSISRQGLTMQVLSGADLLSKGLTGISSVDRVIEKYNPAHVRRKARVYSINKPPPNRRGAVQDSWSGS